MNLFDFEEHVNEIIRKRGSDYYANGGVEMLEQNAEGQYHAVVNGTEAYHITVALDESNNIIKFECDCPYDMGIICKHMVAVFYAVRGKHSCKQEKPVSSELHKKHSLKMDKDMDSIDIAIPQSRLKETLEGLTKEELISTIIGLSIEDDGINAKLNFQYCLEDLDNEVPYCRNLIRSSISKYAKRYGYVPYEYTYEALEGAAQVLQRAEQLIETQKYVRGVNLCLCIVSEMIKSLENIDDSDGYAGSIIEAAIGEIQSISCMDLAADISEALFKRLLMESGQELFNDWFDWRLELVDACVSLSCSDSQKELLLKYLQALADEQREEDYGRYHIERLVLLQYHVLLKYKDSTKASEFLHENIAFPRLRELIIQDALNNNNYEEVIRLALEGERLDAKMRGLVREWRQYRYTAYEQSGQLDLQRELAKQFILEDQFEFYDKLKKTYNKSDWPDIYKEILDTLEKHKRLHNCYLKILIEEKEYNRLLSYVQANPSDIKHYYKYLLEDYRAEVYEVYTRYALLKASLASGRKDYQEVCNIIRQLIKLGGAEQGRQLVAKLTVEYPRKTAFKEELAKIYKITV